SASPVPRLFGDERASHPYAATAALMTAMDRARLKPLSSSALALSSFRRNSTGSALAAAANSSMNDSEANVTCGPLGSRRLPVRSGVSQTSGSDTTCVVIRRLGMVYMSEGVDALPRAGVERLMPAS